MYTANRVHTVQHMGVSKELRNRAESIYEADEELYVRVECRAQAPFVHRRESFAFAFHPMFLMGVCNNNNNMCCVLCVDDCSVLATGQPMLFVCCAPSCLLPV
jgi:hypothetical protein